MAERQDQLTVHPLRPRSEASGSRFTENYRHLLGYDPRLEHDRYRQISNLRNTVPLEKFLRLKSQLDTRTGHNLETALGERFNLQVSQIEYFIEDGLLISPEFDEPFLEVIKRGVRYKEAIGSGDIVRERAEVVGFEKVQKILTNPEHQDVKVILISPEGGQNSMYQHNFFDVYTKKGSRVILRRFLSTSSLAEFRLTAEKIDPFNNLGENPTDAHFLSNPLITYMTEEQIIDLLKLDLGGMTKSEYQKLIQMVGELKLNFINALANGNWNLSQKIIAATLNWADQIVLGFGNTNTPEVFAKYPTFPQEVKAIIGYWSTLPVRPVLAGCGLQAILATRTPQEFLQAMFPYSVAEYANCPECGASANHFHCPKDKGGCGEPIQTGLGITTCPSCGLTKEKAGSSC